MATASTKMRIKNHKIIGVPLIKSPNVGGLFATNLPDTIIIHYTAGASAESSINTLCNPNAQASAHLVIAQDGAMTQLVPFNQVAWHAGKSYYQGKSGFNKYSIGIEIDNAGKLTKSGNKYFSWFGKEYPAELVFEGVHRNENTLSYWHRYTQEQIDSVFKVSEAIREKYAIKLILGHEEIAPDRKTDPGPAFPLEKLREITLLKDRKEDNAERPPVVLKKAGLVNAGKLNIRSRPLLSSNTVASPLTKGTLVNILEESNGWYKVKVETEGWVKKDYIKDRF